MTIKQEVRIIISMVVLLSAAIAGVLIAWSNFNGWN